MERFTNEELLEVLPVGLRETKELTSKQKLVLGQLYIYNGLNKKDDEGFFYRSNKDLSADCDIEEKTVIAAIRKLTILELIKTKRGSRATGASLYKVNEDKIKEYCNTNTVNYSEDYSKQIVEMADRIRELENTVKMLVDKITVIQSGNYSTETETDKDIDIEKDINNNILNNVLEETERIEEGEEGKGEEKPTETQASTPVEEQYQLLIQYLDQFFTEYPRASTFSELVNLKDKTIQAMQEYCKGHQIDNEEIQWQVAGVIAEMYTTHKDRIENRNHQIMKMFKSQSRQFN